MTVTERKLDTFRRCCEGGLFSKSRQSTRDEARLKKTSTSQSIRIKMFHAFYIIDEGNFIWLMLE